MFISITSSEYNVSGIVIIMAWFYSQLAGLVCGYGYWRRRGSMLEQSRWLRSIDIISGRNSIQAASNNKYADKDKYKWAVNMYECLTVDLLDLHPPMALNPRGLSQIYTLICNFLWPCGTISRCNMSWGEWRLNATTVVWMAEIYEQYISLPVLRSLMFLHSNNVTCLLVLTNLEHRHQSILFWSTSIDQLVEHRKS